MDTYLHLCNRRLCAQTTYVSVFLGRPRKKTEWFVGKGGIVSSVGHRLNGGIGSCPEGSEFIIVKRTEFFLQLFRRGLDGGIRWSCFRLRLFAGARTNRRRSSALQLTHAGGGIAIKTQEVCILLFIGKDKRPKLGVEGVQLSIRGGLQIIGWNIFG
jgi:hypothetical protein